jgi:hypothetical protein
MAIEFASVAIVRAGSGSAVGLSHYIDRSNGRDRVNGTSYCFDGKDVDVLGRGLMVPETAPDWAFDTNALWNAGTERELVRDRKTGELRFSRHGEPQVAKSYVLALPKELSAEGNRVLLQSWLDQKFTQAGVAVQWAIHRDHGENGNVHAHVLVSTRRLGPDGFGAKARELNPQFARAAGMGKGFITETGALTREWRAFQDEFFRARGLALTVDPSRMTPQLHLGAAFRTETSALHQANAARAEKERENARRPERVLAHLTARAATFTTRDLEIYPAGPGDRDCAGGGARPRGSGASRGTAIRTQWAGAGGGALHHQGGAGTGARYPGRCWRAHTTIRASSARVGGAGGAIVADARQRAGAGAGLCDARAGAYGDPGPGRHGQILYHGGDPGGA